MTGLCPKKKSNCHPNCHPTVERVVSGIAQYCPRFSGFRGPTVEKQVPKKEKGDGTKQREVELRREMEKVSDSSTVTPAYL